MNCKLMVLVLLVCASSAIAQIPIPHNPDWCGVPDRIDGRSSKALAEDPSFKEFSIPGSGTCSEYTFGGWERPMLLQLGEGAADYLPLIELAVKTWTEAVRPWWGYKGPLIEIDYSRPTNFLLPRDFWENRFDGSTSENRYDGENVIYFNPNPDPDSRVRGFAEPVHSAYPGTGRLVGADIYINTADEEKFHGYTLAKSKKVIDVSDSQGVYVYLNGTYEVILHELGHAIGLGHVPVVGNVMATGTFVDGVAAQWTEVMSVTHFVAAGSYGQISDFEMKFVQSHSSFIPFVALRNKRLIELTEFYTELAKLGTQERILLSCIYKMY